MASSARLDELRKKFDENPRRYFAPLANEYRKAGETDQAIAICREYLPQQPGHMSGHIVFGQALYEARQFEEAKTVFETALSLDPENLIALRHLGDIALILGDSEGARGWYRRVLDADPRNEEIQAQLASLDKAASAAPTPAVTPAQDAAAPPPAPATAPKPTPSSAPTVVVSAIKMPASGAAPPPQRPVTATSPTAEVRLDDILPTHAEPEPPSMSSASTIELVHAAVPQNEPHGGDAPPHAPLEGLESHAVSSEAPPLDSFSLDGLETTSLAAGEPSPVSPTAPPSAPPPSAHAATSDELQPLDLDLGSVASESSDVAQDAVAQAPAVEPQETTSSDLVFFPPEEPAPEPSPVVALQFEEPASASPAPEALDLPLALPSAPATPDMQLEQPIAGETAQPAESGPFVTETMAELYLKQGHRDEALKVYHALMEQRPNDTALAAKVRGIEAGAVPSTLDGERFTDVLRSIAERRPGHRPMRAALLVASPAIAGARQTDSSATDTLPAFEDVPVEHETPPAAAETPVSGARSDRLAVALGFNGNDHPSEAAAMTLAAAFATNGSGALHGAPARQAATELSLDSVFGAEQKAAGPPAPPPSSFSFDQFFANKDAASGAQRGAGSSESAEDVAQFTQWLEGLKRR